MVMELIIVKGDITKIPVDIIVNAANSSLLGGGGVDGAIHRAGGPAILAECLEIRARQGECKTGDAVITTAGRLPANKVIHTVGPVWIGGQNEEEEKLKNCYKKSLQIADDYGAKVISFPCISTGIYRFPKRLAAELSLEVIKSYKCRILEKIIFVCFDEESYDIYHNLLDS